MAFEPYVITDIIKSKLLYQYEESENLIAYIEALTTCFQELEDVFADILNLRQFDNAEGYVLDIYGVLIGLLRGTYSILDSKFLGLDDVDLNNPVPHLGLGDVNDPLVGGIFRSFGQPLADQILLPDTNYKQTLIGKIAKNNFKGGYEEIISAITSVFEIEDQYTVEITEDFTTPTDPIVNIRFYKILTELEKSYLAFLDVLPKAGGIRYEYEDDNGPI